MSKSLVDDMVARRSRMDQEIEAAREFLDNDITITVMMATVCRLPPEGFREALAAMSDDTVARLARLAFLMIATMSFSSLEVGGFFDGRDEG